VAKAQARARASGIALEPARRLEDQRFGCQRRPTEAGVLPAVGERLATFVQNTSSAGTTLLYLRAERAQLGGELETCEWTAAELLTFIRDYLGPALRARNLTTPILAPEYQTGRLRLLRHPLLNDPAAASYLV